MIAFLTLLACAYEAPLDPDRDPMLNAITGTITYEGEEVPGPVHVLAYDVDNPPIPEGTGSPVTFASVDPADFTGEDGTLAAAYGVSNLPDGTYYIRALVDADWDFSPLATATTAASCGDEAGGYLASLGGTQLGRVTVQGGELAENISIIINRSYDEERAAFRVATEEPLVQGGGLYTLSLEAIAVETEELYLAGPAPAVDDLSELEDPCQTGFVIDVIDADGDGLADAHPNPLIAERGYKDVWPRVYMRFSGSEEHPLPEGAAYWATELPNLISFQGWDVDALAASGDRPVLTSVLAGWADLSLLYYEDGSTEEVLPPDIPTDEWTITVAPYSGQVWTLPNETPEFTSVGGWDSAGQELGVEVVDP